MRAVSGRAASRLPCRLTSVPHIATSRRAAVQERMLHRHQEKEIRLLLSPACDTFLKPSWLMFATKQRPQLGRRTSFPGWGTYCMCQASFSSSLCITELTDCCAFHVLRLRLCSEACGILSEVVGSELHTTVGKDKR
ncbi:uncharacterized protein C21orf62 homolog isoform X2 [Lagopus leucura]|uniref:uncharacterized protein C21orf62 homolog isoform X2 n=1 Tax=Lagopus leucura TaxID=30410 RepID=UPI001C6852E2|nr:uncharacterized protein C21orf62 homolog isoform X2 [Lagopus leucura]